MLSGPVVLDDLSGSSHPPGIILINWIIFVLVAKNVDRVQQSLQLPKQRLLLIRGTHVGESWGELILQGTGIHHSKLILETLDEAEQGEGDTA
jgi:hypothetical protein